MYGQEHRLIDRKIAWGEDRVFFMDETEQYRSIPASWTTLNEKDPYVEISKGRAYFKFQDLLELTKLIKQIRDSDL